MDDDTPYDISVDRTRLEPVCDVTVLESAARAALAHQRISEARLGIVLVDDTEMTRLNARHLGHDGPTDVLAFDLADSARGKALQVEVDAPLEGEIYISLDTAAREAARRGHDISAEAALYVVHGVLHLAGYDDSDSAAAARMHALEDTILERLGIGATYHGGQR